MTQPHAVPPPVQDDPTTSAAAKILLAYLSYEAATAALAILLRPLRIGAVAIAAVLRMTDRGTNAKPRPRGYHAAARSTASDELYYRAAYVTRAARRIQADLDAGLDLPTAIGREQPHWLAHERQRRVRQEAVKRDLGLMRLYGDVLGWYLDPTLNNEAECIAADGNNYDPLAGTIIGRPGTVHAGCGCVGGPPHEGGRWVDEAVAGVIVQGEPNPLRPLRRKRRAA